MVRHSNSYHLQKTCALNGCGKCLCYGQGFVLTVKEITTVSFLWVQRNDLKIIQKGNDSR